MARNPNHQPNPRHAVWRAYPHLTLCFRPDGSIDFYPNGATPAQTVTLIKWAASLLAAPERAPCILGICSHGHDDR
jgi:hypothetical protein